jgi:uncharacterized membrane protein
MGASAVETRRAAYNPATRIRSVDIVRGAVMALMAIDHMRVYAGIPAGGITAGLFLTRWVTNFCAPAFAFFAGVSIFLRAERLQNPNALSRWLLVRGAWLVLLELTFLRLAWTFNLDFAHYMLAGVIWMLGWCMILMAAFVRLPVWANAVLGLVLMAGGDLVNVAFHPAPNWFLRILYFGGGIALGGAKAPNFFVLYSILPWIGVMAAGYAFGALLRMTPERRDKTCYAIGGGAITAFILFQCFNHPWTANPQAPGWIAFLSARKYPASPLFLLMTLGPAIAALPLLENARGRLAQWFSVLGRAPLFYYLVHIPLIHATALAISLVRTPAATGWLFDNHPLRPDRPPAGYTWSLGLLYLVTALTVTALYFACRWYVERKKV